MIQGRASWLPILVFVAGCFHHQRARDVATRLAPAQPSSGAIDVVLNSPSRKLSIAIDGNLVVDRAYSRKAHVEGVPAGPAHVRVAVGGRCERDGIIDEQVDVPVGGTTTILLPGPEHRHACMIATGLAHVALDALLIGGAIHLVHAVHAHFAR
jgi:hypothetical protein